MKTLVSKQNVCFTAARTVGSCGVAPARSSPVIPHEFGSFGYRFGTATTQISARQVQADIGLVRGGQDVDAGLGDRLNHEDSSHGRESSVERALGRAFDLP